MRHMYATLSPTHPIQIVNPHTTLDVIKGGQHGWSPNLAQLVGNHAYVTYPLVCLLLEAPRAFENLPNKQSWVSMLRALVETHAIRIEGFEAGLEVATSTVKVGGGGEEQDHYTDVTRARTQPKFSWEEKYGKPIQTFLQYWITYLMKDPETKYANIATITGRGPTDMLLDRYSATMLFIEPDPTHRYVLDAWVTTNMFPKGTGQISAKRDLTAPGEIRTLDIDFTGVSQYGAGVRRFAQEILTNIDITGANPFLRNSFIQRISADVLAAGDGIGSYDLGIKNTATDSVKLV